MSVPSRLKVPLHQVVLAPVSRFRTTGLFATNSLFDFVVALRPDQLLAAVAPIDASVLYGHLLSMGRTSFFLTQCDWGDPVQFLKNAADVVMKRAVSLGVFFIDFTTDILAEFSVPGNACVRKLVRASATKIHRGVRLKWCYYPYGVKYDLIYRRGEWVQLVHRNVQQWTRASYDKVKTIRKWKPSINMADINGWGLTLEQREVYLWDMLWQGSCPDAAIQNWLLTEGGRVLRIDENQQMVKGKHPQGRFYVEFLRLMMCVGDYQGGWKQRDAKEGLLFESPDGERRFVVSKMFTRNHSSDRWNDATYPEEAFPECPMCRACLRHDYRVMKMFRHNNISRPPPACHECYECQRSNKLGSGVPTTGARGCTDVEAVGDDYAAREDYCDTSQVFPLPRPSTVEVEKLLNRGNKALRDSAHPR
eukprot:TRINITY_DN7245_c0_g1_i1.p1 TRINITY_DN7245_c0_g1~~TRINITY_DN7245_c0_g1_i1.p1  ORF type:complete len:420 (+),score=48.37 TRINITY_DN7245_c0_g1_i1:413-1672(+)